MAHVEDRRKQGKGWRVRYRTLDNTEHSRSFARKGDADDFFKTVAADVLRGEYIDPKAGKVRLEDWSTRWLAMVSPTLKPSTAASYKSLLDSRIVPRFGKLPLAGIRLSDVQEWLGAMTAEGLSASRVRKCGIVLKMVMDAAVRDNLIRTNPVVGVKPPRIERREAAYFEPEVVESIANAMPSDEYALLIRVLGVGGLRFGEAAALTRDRVDLVRRRLIVRESLTEVSGRLVRTPTKSYQERQVPLPPSLAAALTAHLDVHVGASGGAPVFRGPQGGELRYRAFHGRVWSPALEGLKLPHVGLHVLRHSAAARMIGAGASAKVVQTVLGHRSAAFTLTVYGHLFDTDLDALAALLDAPAAPSRPQLVAL